jgi:hypothetical protein
MLSGSGRSGTNITKKIFAKSSKVSSLPFEYRFVIDPKGVMDFYLSMTVGWSPYYADYKIRELETMLLNLAKKNIFDSFLGNVIRIFDRKGKNLTTSSYMGWELEKWIPNYSKHVKLLIDEIKDFDYSGSWPGSKSYSVKNRMYFSKYKDNQILAKTLHKFLSNCIIDILTKEGKSFFVDDNTWNFLYAKQMFELFPNSKLIHIYRNPRDVISSYLEQRWSPNSFKEAVLWYKSIMERWNSIKLTLPNDYYQEIKFEELVNNTEYQLNKMCDFTGIPFENKMMEIQLNKANINRWKNDFNNKEIFFLENELKEIIIEYNY